MESWALAIERIVAVLRGGRPCCSSRDWSTRLCCVSIRSCWAGANAAFRTALTRANSLSSARRRRLRACSLPRIDTLDRCEPSLSPTRAAERARNSYKRLADLGDVLSGQLTRGTHLSVIPINGAVAGVLARAARWHPAPTSPAGPEERCAPSVGRCDGSRDPDGP